MTCRRVRKLMSLAAGNDLGPRQTRAFLAHVDACPACRSEFEGFREALRALRTAAREESVPDWSEGEWKALLARMTRGANGPRDKRSCAGARAPWPRWAAGTAAGALVALIVLSMLFRGPGAGPERTGMADGRTDEAAAAREQNVMTMTMVSQETGLQIVWFLDKNFDYEGEKE